MPRINSPAELEAIQEGHHSEKGSPTSPVFPCVPERAASLSAQRKVVAALKEEIKKQGLDANVDVRETGCPGFCERGPIVVIYPEEICYLQVQPGDAEEIVSQTILAKKVIDRLLYGSRKRIRR
jgi:(2Fe-2S) ferredoxin